jgi:hypothetical protein
LASLLLGNSFFFLQNSIAFFSIRSTRWFSCR